MLAASEGRWRELTERMQISLESSFLETNMLRGMETSLPLAATAAENDDNVRDHDHRNDEREHENRTGPPRLRRQESFHFRQPPPPPPPPQRQPQPQYHDTVIRPASFASSSSSSPTFLQVLRRTMYENASPQRIHDDEAEDEEAEAVEEAVEEAETNETHQDHDDNIRSDSYRPHLSLQEYHEA